MLDEELDDIIKEAANQHYPPYNDKAWEKMELVLDKHLPVKKDRWRFFYLFLLLLAIGTGGYFAGVYFSGHKTSVPLAQSQDKTGGNRDDKVISPVKNAVVNESLNIPVNKSNHRPNSDTHGGSEGNLKDNFLNKNSLAANAGKAARKNITIKPGSSEMDEERKISSNKAVDNAIINTTAGEDNDTKSKEINPGNIKDNTATVSANLTPKDKTINAAITEDKKDQPTVKNTIPVETKLAKPAEKNKGKQKWPGNFGISFSAGPDMSFVELRNPGKVTLAYGAGLSYSFGNRISVATGLFIAKKRYSADSADYHPPASFWAYYPNMQNIEADCKVYEIPLSVRYNFRSVKAHNFFAGLGLSSYLMKRETYDYEYKNLSGQTYYRSYTFNNENKHFLSVLSLSGGYQYNISNRLSFAAEPYLKLPLNGIGYGKVKLFSSGVMFTATLKPFAKRN